MAILFSLVALNILPAQNVLPQIEVNYLKLRPRAILSDISTDPRRSQIVQKRIEEELTHKDFQKIVTGQRFILSVKNEVPEPAMLFQKPAVAKSKFLNPDAIKLSFGSPQRGGGIGPFGKTPKKP